MVTDFLSFEQRQTVGAVLEHLRSRGEEYSDYEIQYAYVVSAGGRLRGVLRLRDQLFAPTETPLASIMIPRPVSIEAGADPEALREVFEEHGFIGVPVTDEDGRLVGVVRRADVREASAVAGGRVPRIGQDSQAAFRGGGHAERATPSAKLGRLILPFEIVMVLREVPAPRASALSAHAER